MTCRALTTSNVSGVACRWSSASASITLVSRGVRQHGPVQVDAMGFQPAAAATSRNSPRPQPTSRIRPADGRNWAYQARASRTISGSNPRNAYQSDAIRA